ncbi:histidine phosphatase family protein [Mameliella alba]|nr:histidine phosphatase family protein [Antarctobacter heliothermus]MBY6144503.1 histidine phosphatase family protein [Mameliella alba]MCA0954552.1 histidine phosphatase family protein [Mameliella alba]
MTPPDAAELILIRHAPALHGGRLCGRSDVPARIGDPAAWRPVQGLLAHVAQKVVSPALRCRQTAAAIWPETAPETDARLWEQDFGAHEGLTFDEIPDIGNLTPEALANHCPPGGESFADMVARVRPALEQLADRARAGGSVAVVAHAGTARAALALALGSVPAALSFEIAPWSMTRLRAYPGGLSVITTNWRPL